MKNKEKFLDNIIDFACIEDSIAVDNEGEVTSCASMVSCENCRFCTEKECEPAIKKWLEEECVEPPVISKRDREFLEYIKDDYKYIARDSNGYIFLYKNKPEKFDAVWYQTPAIVNLKHFNVDFPMVKWEDTEPWKIEDLMNLNLVDECE